MCIRDSCSTCGSSCEHVDAKDLIAPLNKDSSIKHVYAIMSGKGGVGKSSTCLLYTSPAPRPLVSRSSSPFQTSPSAVSATSLHLQYE